MNNSVLSNSWPWLAAALCYLCSLFVEAQELVEVEGTKVTRQAIKQQVPLSGTLVSLKMGWLSAQVDGLVTDILADQGERVEQGQVLLQLDDELVRFAVASANAQAAVAEESLSDSRRRLEDARALTSQQSIAETEVEALASEVRAAEARWQGAKADAQRLQASLERHQLRAPFSGVITGRDIDVGEWVSPGAGLLELTGTDMLVADFKVPQRFFDLVDQDTRLQLSFDGYPQQKFEYPVYRRIPAATQGSRSFGLRVQLKSQQDDGPRWYPGMSVSAQMILDMGRSEVTVPNDALIRHPDGRITLWVAQQNAQWGKQSRVREVQVETGLQFENNIEIRKGLSGGEIVIVRGNEALNQDQQIILQQAGR
jgi:membrane fusion protein, multidrug efflux system